MEEEKISRGLIIGRSIIFDTLGINFDLVSCGECGYLFNSKAEIGKVLGCPICQEKIKIEVLNENLEAYKKTKEFLN